METTLPVPGQQDGHVTSLTKQELDFRRECLDDPFLRYHSLANVNPFTTASFRETLKDREAYFPPTTVTNETLYDCRDPWQIKQAASLSMGNEPCQTPTQLGDRQSLSDPRTISTYSRNSVLGTTSCKPYKPSHDPVVERAYVDVWRETNRVPSANSAIARESLRPAPLALRPTAASQPQLFKIFENPENRGITYKVQIHDPETSQVILRSPLKRLFGEKGLLSRSSQDLTVHPSKSKNFAKSLKHRVENMMEALPSVELLVKRPSLAPSNTFPITLEPYLQGHFYMRLELLLNNEINCFLLHELEEGRLSHESFKRTLESWRSKGRAQVQAFRFDLITQRELVGMNVETLHFRGVNAFSRMKLMSVLASWKVLVKEMTVRTFCNADSAIKKHLFDAERVLELIGASSESMSTFQEMRSQIKTAIYRHECLERERVTMNGVERPWSTSRFV